VISFVSKGFPYRDQTEEFIYCNGLLFVFPTRIIVNFHAVISLFVTATYISKARYNLFVLKMPLNSNQSTMHTQHFCQQCFTAAGARHLRNSTRHTSTSPQLYWKHVFI